MAPSESASGQYHYLSEHNPRWKGLLDALADREEITLILGSGASSDAGLPTWAAAIQDILRHGMEADPDLHEDAAARARQLCETLSLTECATMARLLHGIDTNRAVHSALYKRHEGGVRPGFVAQKVAQLAATYEQATIVTTNWDDLLERAFDDIEVSCQPVGPSDPADLGDDTDQRIFHVHGYVPEDGQSKGPVILDERDYSLLSPEALDPLNDALRGDGVLLVGVGMTDPNVVRAAYRTAKSGKVIGDPKRFGLFVATAPDLVPLRRLVEARLREQAIHPVDLRHYGQVAHTLAELLNRRELGETDYWGEHKYGLRLERWQGEIERRWPQGTFDATQTSLYGQLNQYLRELVQPLVGAALKPGENLGLQLWARTIAPVGIEMWAASSQRYSDRWALPDPVEIELNSGYPAVDAIFHGAIIHRDISELPSRWNYVIAVPIVLIEEPWFHLTVGVVTLSSTAPKADSGLRVLREELSALHDRLNTIGFELLNPS